MYPLYVLYIVQYKFIVMFDLLFIIQLILLLENQLFKTTTRNPRTSENLSFMASPICDKPTILSYFLHPWTRCLFWYFIPYFTNSPPPPPTALHRHYLQSIRNAGFSGTLQIVTADCHDISMKEIMYAVNLRFITFFVYFFDLLKKRSGVISFYKTLGG